MSYILNIYEKNLKIFRIDGAKVMYIDKHSDANTKLYYYLLNII
jgi:hypothetical protein